MHQEVERLQSDLELKSAQLEAAKRTSQREKQDLKELRVELDDAKMQVHELTQDKARRTEKMQLDSASREQLMKEKAELALQAIELQHQL